MSGFRVDPLKDPKVEASLWAHLRIVLGGFMFYAFSPLVTLINGWHWCSAMPPPQIILHGCPPTGLCIRKKRPNIFDSY